MSHIRLQLSEDPNSSPVLEVGLSHLTPLHLDPLGLQGGNIEPLLGVDLTDVIACSQSPQRVPGALISSGWTHCSLVFCDSRGEPKDKYTEQR